MSGNPRSSKRAPGAPPRQFRPAGVIEWVKHSSTPPPFIKPTRRRGRRAAGERYERKVQEELLLSYEDYYVPSPWFRFSEVGVERPRWCQPDGLLFQPLYATITIVEVKLQHTPDSWWQLKQLYHPVVARAFPPDLWRYNFCEIVKWHDPAVTYPEPYRMVPDPLALGVGQIGCHIMKP